MYRYSRLNKKGKRRRPLGPPIISLTMFHGCRCSVIIHLMLLPPCLPVLTSCTPSNCELKELNFPFKLLLALCKYKFSFLLTNYLEVGFAESEAEYLRFRKKHTMCQWALLHCSPAHSILVVCILASTVCQLKSVCFWSQRCSIVSHNGFPQIFLNSNSVWLFHVVNWSLFWLPWPASKIQGLTFCPKAGLRYS